MERRDSMNCLATLAFVGLVVAGSESANGAVDFGREVRPVLADHCYGCHGPDPVARKGDLRLDLRDEAMRLRDGRAAIVPGRPDQSELIRRITTEDPDYRMPPPDSKRKLSSEQIGRLTDWVRSGAEWSEHWAFTAPVRPAVPLTEAAWLKNPIDGFVLDRLHRANLQPSPPAEKERLLRRVTLDLTGLPPTLSEVDSFLSDSRSDAYERVVDRLLASPRYGERMVWGWLDAARYADSNGYQGDSERTMWPWRDWVIRAMNENLPFDEFTIHQLAGDLLPNPTVDQVIATGFNRNHMINGEGGRIAEENRVEYVFDQTETVATVWLGVTLGCARCHDHKFDPLSQEDFYKLFAFFNNTPVNGGGGSGQMAPVEEYWTAASRDRLDRLQASLDQAASRVGDWELRLFASSSSPSGDRGGEARVEPVALDSLPVSLKTPPRDRDAKAVDELIKTFSESHPEYGGELKRLKQVLDDRNRLRAVAPRVMVMRELEEPRETFVLVRGAYNKPSQQVTAGLPKRLPSMPKDQKFDRLGLAKWLTRPDHPLTARVTVNRYWRVFFGSGLVRTVQDFGVRGEEPTHPELLDWLATEFVRSGWDVKHMHRLMVTSAVYRQTSRVSRGLVEKDPENRLLSRGPRFRMPSWMLRDQALAVSGLLVDRLMGPPVYPYQPKGMWAEATFGRKTYPQGRGADLFRRSVYTFWRRIVGPPMFFDSATRQTCSVTDQRTNTPLHALITLNDVTYVEAARALAEKVLLAASGSDESEIVRAFRVVLARAPSAAELDVLKRRLEWLRTEYSREPDAAEQIVSMGDSGRDLTLDAVEHAAFTGLCSLILNLDESVTRE